MKRHSWRLFGLTLCSLLVAGVACSASDASKKKRPTDEMPVSDDGLEEKPLPPARTPDYTNNDAGGFDLPKRPNTGGNKDGGKPSAGDAGAATSEPPDDACPQLPYAGDLRVLELMIASRSGSGDRGEWIEVKSFKDCWLNLKGIKIESPRGTSSADSIEIKDDVWLPPWGIFIVADSKDPSINNNLPGLVFSWEASDVLKNDGDTVSLVRGSTTIDTLTYPEFRNSPVGESLSFPFNCPTSYISAWDGSSWVRSDAAWGNFKATPGKDNDDVTCY